MPTKTKRFDFGNIAYDGSLPARNQAIVTLELRDTPNGPEVSVTGQIWERHGKWNRDVLSCGQNLDTMAEFLVGVPLFDTLFGIWKRWHLNGMKAGCEHQRAARWDKLPIDPTKPLDSYGKHCGPDGAMTWNMRVWVNPKEHPQGLLGVPCPTCGYKYGTAWLYEPIPANVMEVIQKLLD